MGLLDAARQPHGVNEKGLFYAFCEILIDKTPVALRRIFIHLWNASFAEWKNTPESGILFAHGPHSTYYTTSIGSGKIQEASKVVQELDQDPTVKKGSRVKLVRSDDQAEFFSTVSESEWKEAEGIGQIKLKDKLFPKNSDGPPSKYQVEVFASQIYDVNFPPRAAASNDGAKKRVLAGNTEDWDLTLVLWALLNSAYELCGNTTDQQMLALKRTLENKDKDQLGVRNVRNCAFGHVQRASMPWQDFVKSAERLLAAMDAIDDVLDLREAADGCRATLEGDIVRALSECSGPEALQQETARTQLEMYQSQLKQWEELEAKRRFTVHSSGDGGFTAGQITAPVTINNYYYSGHTSDPSRGESGDGTQGGGRGEGRGAAALQAVPGALNPPGRWKAFGSHTQRDAEGVVVVERLSADFAAAGHPFWLDVKMRDLSQAAMKEGVLNSDIFLAMITEQYFTRKFCIMELRWAREAGKAIQPIIRAEDKPRIGEFLDMAPEDLKDLGKINFIHLDRGDIDYWELGWRKVLWGFADEELKFLVRVLGKVAAGAPC